MKTNGLESDHMEANAWHYFIVFLFSRYFFSLLSFGVISANSIAIPFFDKWYNLIEKFKVCMSNGEEVNADRFS